MKRGLLLNNIGTPASADSADVKKYLDEFLMDPDVIPLPLPLRYVLVHGLITPKRSHLSGEKYRQIWTERGSPLMVNTEDFAKALQKRLGDEWSVKIGMRYGTPSIHKALQEFKAEGTESILLAPMFPQYADATTGSAHAEMQKQLNTMVWDPKTRLLPAFFDEPGFLQVQSEMITQYAEDSDHVLFSFHGLPEAQIKKNDGCLTEPNCCQRVRACAIGCYRAQTLKTAELIAQRMNLPKKKWSVSFQSRLGRGKWLRPSTEETLQDLAKKGIKKVTVACPAFVADCLETLEEIGIVGRDQFIKSGGQEFQLVPCLNSQLPWIEAFARIIENCQ